MALRTIAASGNLSASGFVNGDTLQVNDGVTLTWDVTGAVVGDGTGIAMTLGNNSGAGNIIVDLLHPATILGHVACNVDSGHWSLVDLGPDAGIEFGGDTGFAPRAFSSYGRGPLRFRFAGTAGHPAYLRSAPGRADADKAALAVSGDPVSFSNLSLYDYVISVGIEGSYGLITDLGNTASYGVVCQNLWPFDGVTRPVLDHVQFVRSSFAIAALHTDLGGAGAGLMVQDCQIIDPPICSFYDGGAANGFRVSGYAADSTIRVDLERVGTNAYARFDGVNAQDCTFAAGYFWPSGQAFAGTWKNILVSHVMNGIALPSNATTDGCYYLIPESSNPHLCYPGSNSRITGCVLDTPNSPGTADLIMPSDNCGSIEVDHNIAPPTMLGNGPAKIVSLLCNSGTTLNVHHNTYCATGGDGGMVALGENYPSNQYAGAFSHVRDNIAWGTSDTPGTSDVVAGVGPLSPSPLPTIDAIQDIDYNGKWKLYSGDCWIDANGANTAVTKVGYRGVRVSGTNIGDHDVVADPQFVDPTRNLIRWWREQVGALDPNYVAGQTATVDVYKAIDYLRQNPGQIATMIAWVQAGAVPQNAAYRGAAHDGTDLGAVAMAAPSTPIDLGYTSPTGSTSISSPQFHGHTFNKGDYFGFFYARSDSSPVHPNSDAFMAPWQSIGGGIALDFFASSASGGNSTYSCIPVNVYDATDPTTYLEFDDAHQHWSYSPPPGVKRVKRAPRVSENMTSTDLPLTGGDYDFHTSDVGRGADGGVAYLSEGYQTTFSADGTNIYGQALAMWDFTVANPLPQPTDSDATDAANLPIFPLEYTYEDYQRDNKHKGRFTLTRGVGHSYFVYPSRLGNGGYGPADADGLPIGIPLGATIRLKQSWYDAHASSYTGQARWFVDCWKEYGLILADWSTGTGGRVSGLTDDGWNQTELGQLNGLPATAFELVDFPIAVHITGPTSVALGSPITLTATHEPATDLNFSYVYPYGEGRYTHADGTYVYGTTAFGLDQDNFSHTFAITPPKAGRWKFEAIPNNGQRYYRNTHTFAVIDPAVPDATTYTVTLSGGGGVGQAVTATVTPGGNFAGTITLTPSGCGLSAPITLTFLGDNGALTATFTPTASGTLVVTGTNSGTLTNPAAASATIARLDLIDDADPAATFTGSWLVGHATSDVFYGTDYHYHQDTATAGDATASYAFSGLTAAHTYRAYITWATEPNRATDVPWQVLDSDGTTVLASGTVDQSAAPAGIDHAGVAWTHLADIQPTGTTATVRILSSNQLPGTNYTIADAAYLVDATVTAYTLALTGGGHVGQAITATVTPDGIYTGTVTLTPSGCGLSTPTTLTFSGSSSPQTFTLTPTQAGTLTVTGTNSGTLANPSPATRTIAPTAVPARVIGCAFILGRSR